MHIRSVTDAKAVATLDTNAIAGILNQVNLTLLALTSSYVCWMFKGIGVFINMGFIIFVVTDVLSFQAFGICCCCWVVVPESCRNCFCVKVACDVLWLRFLGRFDKFWAMLPVLCSFCCWKNVSWRKSLNFFALDCGVLYIPFWPMEIRWQASAWLSIVKKVSYWHSYAPSCASDKLCCTLPILSVQVKILGLIFLLLRYTNLSRIFLSVAVLPLILVTYSSECWRLWSLSGWLLLKCCSICFVLLQPTQLLTM